MNDFAFICTITWELIDPFHSNSLISGYFKMPRLKFLFDRYVPTIMAAYFFVVSIFLRSYKSAEVGIPYLLV